MVYLNFISSCRKYPTQCVYVFTNNKVIISIANCSPFSFITPHPCQPITLSYHELLYPTFAPKAPMTMVKSYFIAQRAIVV